MAVTDALAVETLTARDIDQAQALSREANWNQTAEDWRVFFERGVVFGLRQNKNLAATAALLPAPPVTWLSMVLVTASMRRRGLANTLMQCCLDEAERRGLEPWLDATPAGALVYERIGFRDTGLGLVRLRRSAGTASIPPATFSGASALVEADRAALGFDRTGLITALADRPGSRLYREGEAVALVRDGDRARHIGPVYAPGHADSVALLDRILATESGSLIIDAAAHQKPWHDALQSRGFAVERDFRRMRLGAERSQALPLTFFAAAGPEFG